MKLDEVDLQVLGLLCSNDAKLSVTDIVKEVFSSEIDDNRDLKKFDSKVRTRLNKYKRNDLLVVDDENGVTQYRVNEDKVISRDDAMVSMMSTEDAESFVPDYNVFLIDQDEDHMTFHAYTEK